MEEEKRIEEESKQEEDRPTELLEEEPVQTQEEPKPVYSIPWVGLIGIGVILTLMAACIIVIGVLGGFN